MMTHLTDKADDDALWARIDHALGRIEAAVTRPAPALTAEPDDLAARHADLVARHEAMRAAMAVAIGRIDTLIEAQSGIGADPLADALAAFHPANEEPA